jgi:hypothetical protein
VFTHLGNVNRSWTTGKSGETLRWDRSAQEEMIRNLAIKTTSKMDKSTRDLNEQEVN